MNTEISDSNKTKLTGRIYPAIQSCVSNRYKIIGGYFAIAGLVLSDEERLRRFVETGASLITALVFTAFVIHNVANYWLNAIDQAKYENENSRTPTMELLSSAVMLTLIWVGFVWLNCLLR